MDGMEHDATSMSRRLLLGAGLLGAIIAEGAKKACRDAIADLHQRMERNAVEPVPAMVDHRHL
jgi:hypothetical protein